jgi:Na+-driven multidrug efflux pump
MQIDIDFTDCQLLYQPSSLVSPLIHLLNKQTMAVNIIPIQCTPSSSSPPTTRQSLYTLFTYTYPNMLYNLIQFAISFSSMLFVGRLENSKHLAAASLGNMICNITGIAIGTGLLSALDTLCSTAYGAKQFKLVGLQTQRGLIIITIASLFVAMIWLHTFPILLYVGIDREIATLSHECDYTSLLLTTITL